MNVAREWLVTTGRQVVILAYVLHILRMGYLRYLYHPHVPAVSVPSEQADLTDVH